MTQTKAAQAPADPHKIHMSETHANNIGIGVNASCNTIMKLGALRPNCRIKKQTKLKRWRNSSVLVSCTG